MKNGYYLSVYSNIDKIGKAIHEISRHDHNMTLWLKDGNHIKLIKHLEFERVTGYKHHRYSFVSSEELLNFISQQIQDLGITIQDIQAIFGTPGIATLKDYFNLETPEFSYHGMSHLFASAMMDSNQFYNDNILAISYDGYSDNVVDKNVNEKHMFIGAVCKKGHITSFPIFSPGIIWNYAKGVFSMEEGSLMALAYASHSQCKEPPIPVFSDREKIDNYTNVKYVHELLNPITKKIMNYTLEDKGVLFNYYDIRFSEWENKVSMVMKLIQDLSIRQIKYTIDGIIDTYGVIPEETSIALAGGYALNCTTNTFIMNHYNFADQLIMPATNDGGQAVGMGLYYFHKKMKKMNFKFDSCFLGDEDHDIASFLQKNKNYIEDMQDTLSYFTEDIEKEPFLWFDGRAEIGPRALGHRSIFADARSEKSKDILNNYKKRQWWRPVAPIILEEHLSDWFENPFPSPYMLNNFTINSDKAEKVPAIVHLDGTCRVQSINQKIDQRLYGAIHQFYEKTTVPIICNTSLNEKGEPIVNTMIEAFNFAMRKGIRIMYINGIRLVLCNHSSFLYTEPVERKFSFLFKLDPSACEKQNPHGLTETEYFIYSSSAELSSLNIMNQRHVEIIKRFSKLHVEKYPYISYI